MKSKHLAFGLLLLLLAVSVHAQTINPAQKADIENAVKAKVTQLYGVLDTLSPEAYVKLWSRDKIIGGLGATGLETSFEVMAKGIQYYADNFKSRKTESADPTTVHIVSPEMAIAFGKSTFSAQNKAGNVYNLNMGSTTIWVKETGDWKLAFMAAMIAQKQ